MDGVQTMADAVVVSSNIRGTPTPQANGAEIVRALKGTWSGRKGRACCPAHHDSNASLEVDDKDGKTLVYCQAGCSQDEVIKALTNRGLWRNGDDYRPSSNNDANSNEQKEPIIPVPLNAPRMTFKHPQYGAPVASWPYHAIDGSLVGYITRFNTTNKEGERDKTFSPITFCNIGDGKTAWRSKGIPSPRPLYRLPRVVARTDVPILVTEGEKSADAAQKLFPGFVATTPMHGAKSPAKTDWSPVSSRQVVVWPDNDEPGRKFADAVALLARNAGALDVRIVDVPKSFPQGWDLADTAAEGWTVDQIRELLKPKNGGGGNGSSLLDQHDSFSVADLRESLDAEESDDGKIDAATKAKASARRAMIAGDDRQRTVQRMKKQWPAIAADASRIVDAAEFWFERNKPGGTVVVDGIEKKITSLDALNNRFGMLSSIDHSTTCVIIRSNAAAIPMQEFRLRLAPEVVLTGTKDDGTPAWQAASKVWIGSAKRFVYDKITFTSKPVAESTMNLFTGFGVKPKAGECKLIHEYIFEVICNNDKAIYARMLDLIAWQIQNIGRASRIIVVLISKQHQTGKGTLLENILLKIYGQGKAGHKTVDIKDVTGDFNEVLRGKAYVYLDEALYAGDLAGASKIKGIAATETLSLNAKHLPHFTVPSGVNFWLSSNHDMPVHVEEKDARYWPLNISDAHYNDRPYWKQLYAEIENGGVEAFLSDMLERDVSNFNPQNDVPHKNETWHELVRAGVNQGDVRKWIEESLSCEHLLCVGENANGRWWNPGDSITSMDMWNGYKRWVTQIRGYGIKTEKISKFWERLTELGFTVENRQRVFPPFDTCRALLDASFGKVAATSGDAEEIDF